MNKYYFSRVPVIAFVIAAVVSTNLASGQVATKKDEPTTQRENSEDVRQKIVAKGLNYLASGQAENGSFTERAGAGITALAVTAALRNGKPVDDPMVAKGLKALEAFIKPDGGIYGGGRLKNYETCVATVAFAEANKNGKYKETLANAEKFLKGLQVGDRQRSPDDPWYGGVGYGGSGRPDLSNTAYFVQALRAAGAEANDPALLQAIAFTSRCQNLPGHGNDTEFAALVNDGGFYYAVPTESVDPAKDTEKFTPNGGLRSYGSMTYSGLKSMIYAGLTKDDPRVIAATKWIKNSYSVEQNPGMGDAGLYYYYHTFGSALSVGGMENVVDSKGNQHDWRADLVQELAKRQNPNGSWTNANSRWFENDPNLSTSFALLALSYCKPSPSSESK